MSLKGHWCQILRFEESLDQLGGFFVCRRRLQVRFRDSMFSQPKRETNLDVFLSTKLESNNCTVTSTHIYIDFLITFCLLIIDKP